jgi:hypothetical protein
MSFLDATPRARMDDCLTTEIDGGEVIVYDKRANRAHCLNPTAAAVWKRCDGKTDVRSIAGSLSPDLDQGHTDVVAIALDELNEAGLLFGPAPESFPVDRRQLLRRIGIGVAAATLVPVVTSIVAPTPAAATTCLQSGESCTADSQCCSGRCVGGFCV